MTNPTPTKKNPPSQWMPLEGGYSLKSRLTQQIIPRASKGDDQLPEGLERRINFTRLDVLKLRTTDPGPIRKGYLVDSPSGSHPMDILAQGAVLHRQLMPSVTGEKLVTTSFFYCDYFSD